MQVQVSLTIEIGATADLAEMEQQIQEVGQQAMRGSRPPSGVRSFLSTPRPGLGACRNVRHCRCNWC